jgi:hypothetical protein
MTPHDIALSTKMLIERSPLFFLPEHRHGNTFILNL